MIRLLIPFAILALAACGSDGPPEPVGSITIGAEATIGIKG